MVPAIRTLAWNGKTFGSLSLRRSPARVGTVTRFFGFGDQREATKQFEKRCQRQSGPFSIRRLELQASG